MPTMLEDLRIYSDASLFPNRNGGLEVFLNRTRSQNGFNIYIKASLITISSVFTAEATTFALAGVIFDWLNITEASFISDSQQLVTYINSNSTTPIPRWDAEFYTQNFYKQNKNFKVYKIPRILNTTTHVLVTQARTHQHFVSNIGINCHNYCHISSCPIRDAPDHVLWDNLSHVAVSCCYFYKVSLLSKIKLYMRFNSSWIYLHHFTYKLTKIF